MKTEQGKEEEEEATQQEEGADRDATQADEDKEGGGAAEEAQAESEAPRVDGNQEEVGDESPERQGTSSQSPAESPAGEGEAAAASPPQSESSESSDGSSVSEEEVSSSVSDGDGHSAGDAGQKEKEPENEGQHVSDTASEDDRGAGEPAEPSSPPSKDSDNTVPGHRRLSPSTSGSVISSKSSQAGQKPAAEDVHGDPQTPPEEEAGPAGEARKISTNSEIAAESKAEPPRSLPKLPSLSRRASSKAAGDLGGEQTHEVEPLTTGSRTWFSSAPVAVAALPTGGEEDDHGGKKSGEGSGIGGGAGDGRSMKRMVVVQNHKSDSADQIAKLEAERDALSKQVKAARVQHEPFEELCVTVLVRSLYLIPFSFVREGLRVGQNVIAC